MNVYGRAVAPLKDPPDILGWLRAHHPTLLNLLLLQDEFVSGLIFDDTDPHTISWHVACMAKGDNLIAKMVCEALNHLSPNHCANAILNEGPCP